MWIFLWIVLSSILVISTLWSLQILLRQKQAWEAFAKKRGLAFNKGTFMGPAEINGMIGEYKISFFTAERQEADSRRNRYLTAIEIGINEGLFDDGVAGTKEMLPFMQSLTKLHAYKTEGWQEGHHLFVREDAPAKAYFTPERLETFENVLKTKNADVLIVFNANEFALRLETSDPMQNGEKIDKIITRLIGLADKMRVTPEQREQYAAMIPSKG